ncbi:hypothetical protein D3C85_1037570 [compost metagenome]
MSGLEVLPSASGVGRSSPTISARVCVGTQSLLMDLPSVSFWPPARLCAITPPALSFLGSAMLLAADQPLPPLTIESWMFCSAE